jgi:tRNA-dihydrouridine synthase A
MLGRAAYQTPACLLDVDPIVFDAPAPSASREEAAARYLPYVESQLARGVPLHAMTRHMLGLFHNRPRGRIWRRVLSERAAKRDVGAEVIMEALAVVSAPAPVSMAASAPASSSA